MLGCVMFHDDEVHVRDEAMLGMDVIAPLLFFRHSLLLLYATSNAECTAI